MISYDNGAFEAHGDTARILADLTDVIRGVRYVLEINVKMPEKQIKDILFEAYRLGSMKDDELEELARTHDPEEVIQWDEILN